LIEQADRRADGEIGYIGLCIDTDKILLKIAN